MWLTDGEGGANAEPGRWEHLGMTWLVTGGAGYIGSHVVRAFLADGIDVVVIDDLSSGKAEFLVEGVPFVEANLLDGEATRKALEGVSGVVHLAGYKYAGVSVEKPMHTYTQNVTAMVSLLTAMAGTGVRNVVFSSSAEPAEPVRRDEAHRRVAPRGPGEGARVARRQAEPHLAALLQRGRLG